MYLQDVILRQRDANSGWTSASDGTPEERRYYCQNWRNDVSVVITSAAVMVEWAKFSAYGVPIGLPAGDIDSDFVTDTGDVDAIKTWVAAYDVRADLDLDGDIDATDGTLAEGYEGTTLGWTVLSAANVANRAGYAGYQKDVNLDISHVRNRVLEPHLGRWTRRDPLGYVDGINVYEYTASCSVKWTDPSGLCIRSCIACIAVSGFGAAGCTLACFTAGVFTGGAACWVCLGSYVGAMAWLWPECQACCNCIGCNNPRRRPTPIEHPGIPGVPIWRPSPGDTTMPPGCYDPVRRVYSGLECGRYGNS